ncbi:MAG TPA: rhomboid family intramembrane serine protease [Anaerolineales bacterium]|nr:rhomboid family intramembrane serine protease [Anaerolineales bacterium]
MLPLKDTIPSRTFPIVNWLLIFINVFVFMLMATAESLGMAWIRIFALIPQRFLLDLANPHEYLTIFTSMFMHGGWAHLFSNMLALYIFGDNVEDRMGSGRYLLFYLLSGVAAAAVHIFFNPTSPIPTVGASGAISGVLAAYLLYFPTSRVITLVPLFFLPWFVEIPALFYLGMWFFSQLFNGLFAIVSGVQALGGIAWWAHVGGFAAGFFLAPFLGRRRYVRRYYLDEYYPW